MLHDPSGGRSAGVLVASLMLEDATESRRAEAKRDLLAPEVGHRTRNALAVAQAAVRLTRTHSAADFARAVKGRVAAIPRAQTMLADRHRCGAELRPLVAASLTVLNPG